MNKVVNLDSINTKDKILIAYHANCIDGFTAAWAIRKGLIDVCKVDPNIIAAIPAVYHKIDDLIGVCAGYSTIYIVDFSIPEEDLLAIAKTASVFVLDHHKTAMEMYHPDIKRMTAEERKKIDWNDPAYRTHQTTYTHIELTIHIDMDLCGSSIAWYWFHGTWEPAPKLIQYVQDHDIWTHQYVETRFINKYLTVLPKTFDAWDDVYESLYVPTHCSKILQLGEAMDKYHMMLVYQAAKTAVPISLAGEEGLACNCPGNLASDVGHLLAEESGTYGAAWNQVGNEVKFSLRSSKQHGNYDVATLCKKFNGGGQHNAAGFVLSAPVRDEIFPDGDSPIGIDVWRI